MNQEELIDNELFNEAENAMDIIRWWEQKRWVFNLVVMLIMSSYLTSIYNNEKILIILFIGFYLIAVNASFCMGWGLELLWLYYFNNHSTLRRFRSLILVLGFLFSIIITTSTYASIDQIGIKAFLLLK